MHVQRGYSLLQPGLVEAYACVDPVHVQRGCSLLQPGLVEAYAYVGLVRVQRGYSLLQPDLVEVYACVDPVHVQMSVWHGGPLPPCDVSSPHSFLLRMPKQSSQLLPGQPGQCSHWQ